MEEFSELDILSIAKEFSIKSSSHFDSFITIGIGDDSFNFLPPEGYEISVTTDSLIENIHFKREWYSFFDIGWKSCAVNISDLASMGAHPAFLLLNLGITDDINLSQVKELIEGFVSCANCYRAKLVGGDTVKSERIVVSVTAIGFVEKGKALKRSAAIPGMKIFVSGSLGASAAGLILLSESDLRLKLPEKTSSYLILKHLRPEAQVELGRKLIISKVSVCEDISDGLAREVINICKASGVGARLIEKSIPVDEKAVEVARMKGINPVRLALSGGEDYQLVFAAFEEQISELSKLTQNDEIKISEIGKIVEVNDGVKLERENGVLEPLYGGYDHFKKDSGII